MMAASSSNVPPTSLPFPAIVSSSSVVVWCGRSDRLSASAIFAMAASCVWPVALPGCMLYSWCGVSSMRPRSSASAMSAKSRVCCLSEAGFSV